MHKRVSDKLIPGLVFLVSAVVLYLIMPSQIKTTETTAFTARTFPTIALGMIGLCALFLIIQGIMEKCGAKNTVAEEAVTVEKEYVSGQGNMKMFAYIVTLLIGAAVIGNYTSLLVSGLLLGEGFLILYRDKKILHYVIVISVVVLSYFLFKQVFGLQLP